MPEIAGPTLRAKLSRLMHLLDELAGMTEEDFVEAFDDEAHLEGMLEALEATWFQADATDAVLALSDYSEALADPALCPTLRAQGNRESPAAA